MQFFVNKEKSCDKTEDSEYSTDGDGAPYVDGKVQLYTEWMQIQDVEA